MNNVVNSVAYLRTSREFPEDLRQLTVEVNKAYIDTANSVNNKIIGIFPVNRPAITGESWFLTNQRQQTLRQVFPFTSAGNIPHSIIFTETDGPTRIYGTFTDGTKWYPLPYVDVTAANNQITIDVTSATTTTSGNVEIIAGAGAPPTIVSGRVVIEWLSSIQFL